MDHLEQVKCPHCDKMISPRFWHFTQHEQSILLELFKDQNLSLIYIDSTMPDQNSPCETTRKKLLKELQETPCSCCYKEED